MQYNDVGLIILRAQPFHNGHVKIISEALMRCIDVVLVFIDYDTSFFNYNINQQCGRNIFNNRHIYYHGTPYSNIKHNNRLEYIIDSINKANIPLPTLLLSGYDSDIEEAKNIGLKTLRIGYDPKFKSDIINIDVQNITNTNWKQSVPPLNHDLIETYVYTKLRDQQINEHT